MELIQPYRAPARFPARENSRMWKTPIRQGEYYLRSNDRPSTSITIVISAARLSLWPHGYSTFCMANPVICYLQGSSCTWYVPVASELSPFESNTVWAGRVVKLTSAEKCSVYMNTQPASHDNSGCCQAQGSLLFGL